MHILAGDLGGTLCRLAVAELTGDAYSSRSPGRPKNDLPPPGDGPRGVSRGPSLTLSHIRHYPTARYASLTAVLEDYQPLAGGFTHACLAVAGPTDGRRVRFTNLDWDIDADALKYRFDLTWAGLINDFAAVGWGLNTLDIAQPDERLSVLQPGLIEARGVRLAIGAGTGLGASLCAWRDGRYHPLPGEGGHIGFAPADAEQDAVLAYLRALHGRGSVERILSGPGLVDLYKFCLGLPPEPDETRTFSPADISAAGLAGKDPAAARALRLFVRIYGQVAGDMALLGGARGGIYIAGGIAAKLLPLMRGPDFIAGLRDKGRFSAWAGDLPVAVVLDGEIGLKGAALACAARAESEQAQA